MVRSKGQVLKKIVVMDLESSEGWKIIYIHLLPKVSWDWVWLSRIP